MKRASLVIYSITNPPLSFFAAFSFKYYLLVCFSTCSHLRAGRLQWRGTRGQREGNEKKKKKEKRKKKKPKLQDSDIDGSSIALQRHRLLSRSHKVKRKKKSLSSKRIILLGPFFFVRVVNDGPTIGPKKNKK